MMDSFGIILIHVSGSFTSIMELYCSPAYSCEAFSCMLVLSAVLQRR